MTKRERCEIAAAYHKEGNSCSQVLLMVFRDKTGLSEQQSIAVGSGLGGGMHCGSICGSVGGAVLVLGFFCPATDAGSKARNTAITKEFQRRFQEQFGALDCRDLLAAKDLCGTPIAEELAHGNHCRLMIVSAVELLSDYLDELERE